LTGERARQFVEPGLIHATGTLSYPSRALGELINDSELRGLLDRSQPTTLRHSADLHTVSWEAIMRGNEILADPLLRQWARRLVA
jgi:hypothetical protein